MARPPISPSVQQKIIRMAQEKKTIGQVCKKFLISPPTAKKYMKMSGQPPEMPSQ